MVLEAFAAVGLAGNIVQFVDFSVKLFDHTRAVKDSCTGLALSVQKTESLAESLQQICTNLEHSNLNCRVSQPGQANQSLLKLAQDCEIAASELLGALQKLKARDPSSTWSNFRAALMTMWKEKQIEDMEETLDYYRSQLILQLQIMQRYIPAPIGSLRR